MSIPTKGVLKYNQIHDTYTCNWPWTLRGSQEHCILWCPNRHANPKTNVNSKSKVWITNMCKFKQCITKQPSTPKAPYVFTKGSPTSKTICIGTESRVSLDGWPVSAFWSQKIPANDIRCMPGPGRWPKKGGWSEDAEDSDGKIVGEIQECQHLEEEDGREEAHNERHMQNGMMDMFTNHDPW